MNSGFSSLTPQDDSVLKKQSLDGALQTPDADGKPPAQPNAETVDSFFGGKITIAPPKPEGIISSFAKTVASAVKAKFLDNGSSARGDTGETTFNYEQLEPRMMFAMAPPASGLYFSDLSSVHQNALIGEQLEHGSLQTQPALEGISANARLDSWITMVAEPGETEMQTLDRFFASEYGDGMQQAVGDIVANIGDMQENFDDAQLTSGLINLTNAEVTNGVFTGSGSEYETLRVTNLDFTEAWSVEFDLTEANSMRYETLINVGKDANGNGGYMLYIARSSSSYSNSKFSVYNSSNQVIASFNSPFQFTEALHVELDGDGSGQLTVSITNIGTNQNFAHTIDTSGITKASSNIDLRITKYDTNKPDQTAATLDNLVISSQGGADTLHPVVELYNELTALEQQAQNPTLTQSQYFTTTAELGAHFNYINNVSNYPNYVVVFEEGEIVRQTPLDMTGGSAQILIGATMPTTGYYVHIYKDGERVHTEHVEYTGAATGTTAINIGRFIGNGVSTDGEITYGIEASGSQTQVHWIAEYATENLEPQIVAKEQELFNVGAFSRQDLENRLLQRTAQPVVTEIQRLIEAQANSAEWNLYAGYGLGGTHPDYSFSQPTYHQSGLSWLYADFEWKKEVPFTLNGGDIKIEARLHVPSTGVKFNIYKNGTLVHSEHVERDGAWNTYTFRLSDYTNLEGEITYGFEGVGGTTLMDWVNEYSTEDLESNIQALERELGAMELMSEAQVLQARLERQLVPLINRQQDLLLRYGAVQDGSNTTDNLDALQVELDSVSRSISGIIETEDIPYSTDTISAVLLSGRSIVPAFSENTNVLHLVQQLHLLEELLNSEMEALTTMNDEFGIAATLTAEQQRMAGLWQELCALKEQTLQAQLQAWQTLSADVQARLFQEQVSWQGATLNMNGFTTSNGITLLNHAELQDVITLTERSGTAVNANSTGLVNGVYYLNGTDVTFDFMTSGTPVRNVSFMVESADGEAVTIYAYRGTNIVDSVQGEHGSTVTLNHADGISAIVVFSGGREVMISNLAFEFDEHLQAVVPGVADGDYVKAAALGAFKNVSTATHRSVYGGLQGQNQHIRQFIYEQLPFYESLDDYVARMKTTRPDWFDADGNIIATGYDTVWASELVYDWIGEWNEVQDFISIRIRTVLQYIWSNNGDLQQAAIDSTNTFNQDNLTITDVSGNTIAHSQFFWMVANVFRGERYQGSIEAWNHDADKVHEAARLTDNFTIGGSSNSGGSTTETIEASRSTLRTLRLIEGALMAGNDPRTRNYSSTSIASIRNIIASVQNGNSLYVAQGASVVDGIIMALDSTGAIIESGLTVAELTDPEIQIVIDDLGVLGTKVVENATAHELSTLINLYQQHFSASLSTSDLVAWNDLQNRIELEIEQWDETTLVQTLRINQTFDPVVSNNVLNYSSNNLLLDSAISEAIGLKLESTLIESGKSTFLQSRYASVFKAYIQSLKTEFITALELNGANYANFELLSLPNQRLHFGFGIQIDTTTISFIDDLEELKSRLYIDITSNPNLWNLEGVNYNTANTIRGDTSLGRLLHGFVEVRDLTTDSEYRDILSLAMKDHTGIDQAVWQSLFYMSSEQIIEQFPDIINAMGMDHLQTLNGPIESMYAHSSAEHYEDGMITIFYDQVSVNTVNARVLANGVEVNIPSDKIFVKGNNITFSSHWLADRTNMLIQVELNDGISTTLSNVFTVDYQGQSVHYNAYGVNLAHRTDKVQIEDALGLNTLYDLPEQNRNIIIEFYERHLSINANDPLRYENGQWVGIDGGTGIMECKQWLQLELIKDATGVTIGNNTSVNNEDASWQNKEGVTALAGGRTENLGEFSNTIYSSGAKAGDIIQYSSNLGPHTMVISNITATGIWVIDTNYVGDNTVGLHFMSFEYLDSIVNKATIYRIES